MRSWVWLAVATLFCAPVAGWAQQPPARIEISAPKVVLRGIAFPLDVALLDSAGTVVHRFRGSVRTSGLWSETVSRQTAPLDTMRLIDGRGQLANAVLLHAGVQRIMASVGNVEGRLHVRVLPGFVSLLPPVLAIGLALAARQVIIALFFGIWVGVTFVYGYNPFAGLFHALDQYLIGAFADPDHAAIVMFSMTLGGMVGVIAKAGGTQGIVESISRFAKGPRGAQLASWALGVFIFFDDYANTLIVGNTMRPFTDRMRVSREKLSYIVDSTAAPVASIALISTWVGFQVGLIDSAFKSIGLQADPYLTFLRSIPFSAYSVLAVFFVALIALTVRDFGPMWRAEHRTRMSGKVLRDRAQPISDAASLEGVAEPGLPLRWLNAFVPIAVMIVVTVLGLYFSGKAALGEAAASARLGEVFGAADSFDVLMWASFAAATTAILLAVSQRILSLGKAIEAWLGGARAMVLAMVILILAWGIGNVCRDLHTADYVIHWARKFLSPHLLPALTFTVAAFVSFSTGTSWATMAILIPIVVPMAHKLAAEQGLAASSADMILLGTVGAVLSGSVFGDHCSPISDTTIMSSMASAADHVDHVRTQAPYALIVAAVALLVGYLPSGYGFNPVLGLVIGVAVLLGLIFAVGRPIAHPGRQAAE